MTSPDSTGEYRQAWKAANARAWIIATILSIAICAVAFPRVTTWGPVGRFEEAPRCFNAFRIESEPLCIHVGGEYGKTTNFLPVWTWNRVIDMCARCGTLRSSEKGIAFLLSFTDITIGHYPAPDNYWNMRPSYVTLAIESVIFAVILRKIALRLQGCY